MSARVPRVVIVGRTNVGKSTFFNRLSDQVKSLAFDEPGVTRDMLVGTVSWKDRVFELVDTGGFEIQKSTDVIYQQVNEQVIQQIERAALVLFMVDGTVGVLEQDRYVARMLHRLKVPVAVIINKADDKRVIEYQSEFERLGFSNLFMVSAQHGRNIEDVMQWIVEQLPVRGSAEEDSPAFRVVLLGKPNVGKSSLVNTLLKKERLIVSDIPGTTREAVGETIRLSKENVLLVDTPGVRRKRAVQEDLETLMVKSTMQAINQADIVLLMIDASQGEMVDQELKLAFFVFTQKQRALILLLNKQDIATEHDIEVLRVSMEPYKHLLEKLVVLNISCKSGKNISKILPTIGQVWQRHCQQLPDDRITMVLKDALKRTPLYKSGHQLTLKWARQIRTAPLTIELKMGNKLFLTDSHKAFFDRVLRAAFDLRSVPIVFVAI